MSKATARSDRWRDRDFLFHKKWLGLAQPIEGLVFSIPVLADAQIAPEVRPTVTAAFDAHLDASREHIRDLASFFRDFLGYREKGMLVSAAELPPELAFYAQEGGEEIRPTYALARGPFNGEDPFAAFDETVPKSTTTGPKYFALIWEVARDLDLDRHDDTPGAWRYPPTQKLERLLRHVGIPIGLLFNGRELRLVYAPAGETTGHLTFRVEHLQRSDGRPILAALELLLGAARAYTASEGHTLEGLLRESRRRQADVTDALAKQVFEAVEILVGGFEAASAREDRIGWLRAALEEDGDHFYQGVLSLVLRLVFILYAEDQSLLPMDRDVYAAHLSLASLHARLTSDAGAHPESMHHRFGAYGQLVALFRAVFFGVKHAADDKNEGLDLPPRRGRLFDPNTFPFLEGGLPGWTAAVVDPNARAAVEPPSIDDGTVFRVLDRLVVFEGQRLSYRTLDVEQIGSVYESLMGYHVQRVESGAVRVGKYGVWIESARLRAMSTADRAKFLKEVCGLNPGPVQSIEKATKAATDDAAVVMVLSEHAPGRDDDLPRHRVGANRLVVQPGEERRRTGSHYTPRSLTEKVVDRTLEPLLACLGPDRTVDQILQLKICDPAMGSGAFLVASCRALAREVVAAWTRAGELARVIEVYGDAHLHARRLVAQRCLYGVDKNAAAVELAKLSLWLVTLSRTLPFTFVDHALRHGDSLVGLDFRQIEAFHWAPEKQLETCAVLLREALDQAVDLRQQILALADHEDVASQAEKRRLLEFSQQAIERVRVVADVCVGAFFAERRDALRDRERKRRLAVVERWLAGADDAGDEVMALAHAARETLSPFHWWIEFPEVFFEERPDPLQQGEVNGAALMEGVVGNPPFAGKNTLSESHHPAYIEWLQVLHPGAHGNSDLSAHFFRRASSLLGAHGAFGLIATNTIAQGDTRTSALVPLMSSGWELYDATSSMPWPGTAAVSVSVVHAARGHAAKRAPVRLNGAPVKELNSRLRPKPERADPRVLTANSNVIFQGTIILGMGFTLTPGERDELVRRDQRNGLRIKPYIGGEEVNTSPTHDFERYVIGFGQMTLEQAEAWPDLVRIVREKVKPERDRQADNADGRRRKQYWWQYGRETPALTEAIAGLGRCLVTLFTSKHLAFTFQPTDRIFANSLWVMPLEAFTAFSVLQSRVHECWARLLSSSLEDRLRYSGTDCFETFPFPQPNPRAVTPELEQIGETLYDARAKYMANTAQGLTKTYNALKDPHCGDARIIDLRRMHEDLDRAVLAVYGWSDIPVPPFCPAADEDRAAVQAFEDEVIDRLYLLNEERARRESQFGATEGKSAATAERDLSAEALGTKSSKRGAGKKRAKKDQGKLFGDS